MGISLIELSYLESNQAIQPTKELLDLLAHHLKLDDRDTELLHQLGITHCTPYKTTKNLADYISTVPCTRTALRTDKSIDWLDDEWIAFTNNHKVVDRSLLADGQTTEVTP